MWEFEKEGKFLSKTVQRYSNQKKNIDRSINDRGRPPWKHCAPEHTGVMICLLLRLSASFLLQSAFTFLTAHRSAWWSGPRHVGMRLSLGPVHDGPSEDTLQLFSVWWGDGVSANCQLHQGQTHAPYVRLNRVVSALQSLRLLRNTQPTSEGAGKAKMAVRREGWAEGWVG